jgi:hypothetical protein
MALLNFPSSPTNNQTYPANPLPGQSQYIWSSANQTWLLLGPATGVSIGTYGDSSNVGQFTVDTQGKLTSAANVPIDFPTTLTFVTAPSASTSTGTSGEIAVDSNYLYVYAGTQWERVAWDTTPW